MVETLDAYENYMTRDPRVRASLNTFLGYFMDKYEQEFGFQTTSVFGPKNAPMSRKVNFMNMTDADIEALSEAKLKEGLAGRGVGVKKQLQKSELVKLAKRL